MVRTVIWEDTDPINTIYSIDRLFVFTRMSGFLVRKYAALDQQVRSYVFHAYNVGSSPARGTAAFRISAANK